MTQQYGRNYSNNLTIQRIHDYELDVAIEDLLKRGYELVNRGVDERDIKQFGFNRDTRGPKMSFSGSDVHRKCWARLRRVDNTSEIPPSVAYTV
jgi:hypothetical protein